MAFTTSNGHTQTALADINITPLVDVVLVLLVIFMISAPVLQSGIEVAVPKTKTVREITEQRLVVTIDREQRVFLGDQPVNLADLPSRLRKPGRPTTPSKSSISAPTKMSPSGPSPPSWTPSNKPASPTSAS